MTIETYEQTFQDETPSGWVVDRIRNRLGPIIGGEWGEDPDSQVEGVDIAVIRVADIRGLDLAADTPTIRRVKETKIPSRLIGKRSILIEKSGGGEQTPVGRAVRCCTVEFPAICSNFMAKTDCRHNADPSYLAYVLNDLYSCAINTAHIQQTTGIQNLRVSDYLSTKIAFPPVSEQHEIASRLDESCAAIDAAIEGKQRQIEILAEVGKATISETMIRGIRDVELKPTNNPWIEAIPSHWNLVSLKRICDIQTGLTLGKQYDGPLIERPYLRVANVQDGFLNLADVSTIEVPASVAAGVELRKDDVLMTEGGDLDKLGRGHVWNGEIEPCLHQNHIFAVRCFPHKLLPKFLAYLTASRYGRDYFEATGKRTTNLASTNSTKVGLFPIPLPKTSEQEEIIGFLDKRLEDLRCTRLVLESQISILIAYRKSFIHEYITGKRRTADKQLSYANAHA